jgi:hypothetical protein
VDDLAEMGCTFRSVYCPCYILGAVLLAVILFWFCVRGEGDD